METERRRAIWPGEWGEGEEKYHVHAEHLMFKTQYHLQSKLISVVQNSM